MENNVTCTRCGHVFPLEEALSKQLDKNMKEEISRRLEEQRKQLLDDQNKMVEEARAKTKAEEEEKLGLRLRELEEENEARKKENRELKEKELKLMRMEKGLKEKEEELELRIQKQLLEQQTVIEAKVKAKAEEGFELERKEMQRKLDDAIKQASEIERKAKLGSQQSQGETQEEAIEEFLINRFPLDTIEEIKKGERGADCVQIVHTRSAQNCGRIYYESKRAKNFNVNWIEKFKNDIREKGADIGVLVSQVLPDTMNRMGLMQGVWVCTYEEFKGLSSVLRQSIIQLHNANLTQDNKGDKMSMLYDYLTSTEFRMNVEGIVEGFVQMKADLDKEKRSLEGHWKRREKQLDKVLLNTNYFYNSIKGIAGNAIQTVEALELPEGEESDDEM